MKKSKLSYQEAQELSLKVKWKVSLCTHQGKECWCRIIEPLKDIKDKDDTEIYIVSSGCISKIHAEHIVKLHNTHLENNTL